MKVEDRRVKPVIPFGELCIGDVFEYECIYIKIGTDLGLDIYTNDFEEIKPEWYVKKLNAKIVITGCE